MKSRILVTTFALLVSACTVTPQSNGSVDAQFHPPIVAHSSWQVKPYMLATGDRACAISSGYNGITVLLSHPPGREEGVVVESDRRMEPGTTFTISVNGSNYETLDKFFSPASGRELVQQFAKGGKAYFDWAEISGPPGPSRIHTTNIVQLDDFPALMKQCEASFNAPANAH